MMEANQINMDGVRALFQKYADQRGALAEIGIKVALGFVSSIPSVDLKKLLEILSKFFDKVVDLDISQALDYVSGKCGALFDDIKSEFEDFNGLNIDGVSSWVGPSLQNFLVATLSTIVDNLLPINSSMLSTILRSEQYAKEIADKAYICRKTGILGIGTLDQPFQFPPFYTTDVQEIARQFVMISSLADKLKGNAYVYIEGQLLNLSPKLTEAYGRLVNELDQIDLSTLDLNDLANAAPVINAILSELGLSSTVLSHLVPIIRILASNNTTLMKIVLLCNELGLFDWMAAEFGISATVVEKMTGLCAAASQGYVAIVLFLLEEIGFFNYITTMMGISPEMIAAICASITAICATNPFTMILAIVMYLAGTYIIGYTFQQGSLLYHGKIGAFINNVLIHYGDFCAGVASAAINKIFSLLGVDSECKHWPLLSDYMTGLQDRCAAVQEESHWLKEILASPLMDLTTGERLQYALCSEHHYSTPGRYRYG